MSKKVKARHAFKFIKQSLLKGVLNETTAVCAELLDESDNIGKPLDARLRKKISKITDEAVKAVEIQGNRVAVLSEKFEKLNRFHIKRRRVVFELVREYLDKLDAREQQELDDKYCYDLDRDCLEGYIKHNYSEEREFGLKPISEIEEDSKIKESPSVHAASENDFQNAEQIKVDEESEIKEDTDSDVEIENEDDDAEAVDESEEDGETEAEDENGEPRDEADLSAKERLSRIGKQ